MTKTECENMILDLMGKIRDVYHEYNPDGKYLSLSINENMSVNNRYWGEDKDHQLSATLFDDGDLGRYWMDENGEMHTEYEGAVENAG